MMRDELLRRMRRDAAWALPILVLAFEVGRALGPNLLSLEYLPEWVPAWCVEQRQTFILILCVSPFLLLALNLAAMYGRRKR
jgi:hypothetical protein